MKITLIEPKAPGKHVFSMVNMPRLGLPILGTLLEQAGHEVRLIMGSRQDVRLSHIDDADLIGISTTTSTALEAYHLGDFARKLGKTVVMGGAHASFLSDEALEHSDYVCRGESETSFVKLVNCLEHNLDPGDIPGLSYHCSGTVIHNPSPGWIDASIVPYPDLSMFEKLKMSTYPVMTSRGCPYDCTFCSVTAMFGRKYRYRDSEKVIDELRQYHGKQVFFVDDNFTANPRHTKELLRMMIESGVQPSWWCAQVRTDSARDDELLKLMYDSGCRMVFVGLESVNPKTLERYNKKQDIDDIRNCVQQFHKHKIMVHGMFVFGADDDTVETINDTLEFSLVNRIDSVQFLILTPLPGSRTFDEMKAQNRLITTDWNLYDAHHVVYAPEQMSAAELQQAVTSAFKKFYSFANIFRNIGLTGLQSAIFRATGFWLIRRWERENRWYNRFLEALSSKPLRPQWMDRITKSVEIVRLRRLRYLASEKLLDIEVFNGDNTFMINLKGCLNDFALAECVRSTKKYIPEVYQNIIINAEELSYASEAVIIKFISQLNKLSRQARSVEIKLPLDNRVVEILQKHDLNIPGFALFS